MAIPDHLGFTEPYFVALGGEVREAATKSQATWIRLALGNGPSNRVFAVILGYCVVTFLLCLYLNVLTVGNARTAGIAVRNAVRQQLLVLKVCSIFFMSLYLTLLSGCNIHLHRIGHFPSWMWYCAGSLHCMVIPGGQHAFPGCVLRSSSSNCHVLPLGRWDHVYVSIFVLI